MIVIRLEIDVPAPVDAVWARLADLSSHADWMADAESIQFLSTQRTGVGTQLLVPTRLGPFHVTDRMEVVDWVEGRTIAVTHIGVVSGHGRFDLSQVPGGTMLTWSEELRFPWWLGGPVGAWFASPFLRWVWLGNLRRLARLVSSP